MGCGAVHGQLPVTHEERVAGDADDSLHQRRCDLVGGYSNRYVLRRRDENGDITALGAGVAGREWLVNGMCGPKRSLLTKSQSPTSRVGSMLPLGMRKASARSWRVPRTMATTGRRPTMKARVRVASEGRGAGGERGVGRGACFGRDLPIRAAS